MDVEVNELSTRQAVEEVLDLLSGQWVVAVLVALTTRSLRFDDLRDEINAVEDRVGRRTHRAPLSRKVLAATLDRMEDDGLVVRLEVPVTPSPAVAGGPRVRYELSPTGRSLLVVLRQVAGWAQRRRASMP